MIAHNVTMAGAASNPALAAELAGTRMPGRDERLVWVNPNLAPRAIERALASLGQRHLEVILDRFGAHLTLSQCGEKMDLSRERVRQIEAKALRILRGRLRSELPLLRDAVKIVPVPGGPLDPNWISVKEARRLTDLSLEHIRYLCRMGKVITKHKSWYRAPYHINRASLKNYVLSPAPRGLRRGIWKGG